MLSKSVRQKNWWMLLCAAFFILHSSFFISCRQEDDTIEIVPARHWVDYLKSTEKPDIIMTAAGDIASHEMLEAMKIIRLDMPNLKMRFVGINALSYRAIGTTDNKLSHAKFKELFLEN